MMIKSNLVVLQLAAVVLLMVTLTATENAPHSSIAQVTHSLDTEQHQNSALTNQHQTIDDSKQIALSDDDDDFSTSDSDEEYNYNHHRHPHHNPAVWPQIVHKRYSKMSSRAGSLPMNGGETRQWPIPYRFGKRAAMPYRFGKRAAAAMHFRLGKKNASS